MCGKDGVIHHMTCRLKQTAERSTQAIHEGSLCGALPHCSCPPKVWSPCHVRYAHLIMLAMVTLSC